MSLIAFIGYYTESEQTLVIKSSIFVSQFFNTAILLLLTNANTRHTILAFLPFRGIYPDLTQEWYSDVSASLVNTMRTAAFWPIIEFCIFFAMKLLFRLLDRSCRCNSNRTKSKSIQQSDSYMNLEENKTEQQH